VPVDILHPMVGTRARDWAEVDFYAVLGLPPQATDEEIGRAFRALAKQFHPDSAASPGDPERFKAVSAAYEVLGDARVRRDYDFVRAQVAAATRPVAARTPAGTGAFRSARRPKGWTRARAWLALVSGILTILLGLLVAIVVWDFRIHSGDPGAEPDPARDITLAIVAAKLFVGGPVFVVLGARHLNDRRTAPARAPRVRAHARVTAPRPGG
jgi:hypothetical protein